MTTDRRASPAWIAWAAAVLALTACLFDKPKEEVDLTLTKVPAGTDRIVVKAVDKSDTSVVIEANLFSAAYVPGKVYTFGLGKAQGKQDNVLLRVEGYRGSLMVYMSLIHARKGSTDEILFPDVTHTWPTITFSRVAKESSAYAFSVVMKGAPEGARWRLTPNVPQPNQLRFHPSGDGFSLGTGGLIAGTWITAQLTEADTSKVLPVQVPDSMLTDELVSPSGGTVKILDAIRNGDTVEFTLDVKNFTPPSRDEPAAGRGWAKVLDARGLRPIPDFTVVNDDITKISGPAWRLGGVTDIVVALHYANGSRVRPLAADFIKASAVLLDRPSLPKVKIASRESVGTAIRLTFAQTNFETGMHVHVFKDEVDEVSGVYQLCLTSTCSVQPDVHTGAKRLIAIAVNPNHSLYTPQTRDTLNVPW